VVTPARPPSPAASTPAAPTLASTDQTRPGNGYGDKNHVHTGPPGGPTDDEQSGDEGGNGSGNGNGNGNGNENGHGHGNGNGNGNENGHGHGNGNGNGNGNSQG
jgi:hypothetical protein